MTIDIKDFFRNCNPTATINYADMEQRKYYIDFSSVREGQGIEGMADNITWSPDEFSCQLFTGHIGCGKSTELLRLKALLEKEGFHVVYFGADQVLEVRDVDISDILFAIARQVIDSLKSVGIEPSPKENFGLLLDGMLRTLREIIPKVADGLTTNLYSVIEEWLAKAKDSPDIRNRLRSYSEPFTPTILEAVNRELLAPAIRNLVQDGKRGLVVIVDNLDRVENVIKVGKMQPEYLFVDRGEQLKLNCHVVYTVPFELTYQEGNRLMERFSDCSVLPMIPVTHRDGRENAEGMALMRQMALSRAFPDKDDAHRDEHLTEIFDRKETLDRLCRVSGGHVRRFLRFLHLSIKRQKRLPISEQMLEDVIREDRNKQARSLSDEEWEVLKQVRRDKKVRKSELFQHLQRQMFIFEYQDRNGAYADVNPVLADAAEMEEGRVKG